MPISEALKQLRARPNEVIELDQPIEVRELPTPALILERKRFEKNLRKMSDHLAQFGKGFRPHAKTHKCPIICQAQIAAGAVGVCVAKPSEAYVMACAGVQDILLTSPITTASKAQIVVAALAMSPHLKVVVDSHQGLDVLLNALATDREIGLLIDLDVEMGRTGNRDVTEIVELIKRIEADSRTHFVGVQHYAGHVMHINGHSARREKSLQLWGKIEQMLTQLKAEGVRCDVVTGCGTGTYDIDVEVDSVTDLQVGSYVFMDEEYRQIGSTHAERFEDFEVSLSMAVTAISKPAKGAITLDGGYKAFASDTVPPVSDEFAETKFRFAGDEHGVLIGKTVDQSVRLGDVVQLVTPHCDPTVNLHDQYWVQEEDGLIHSIWPITARGCTW